MNFQKLVSDEDRIFDLLNFRITCWSDWHWEKLRQEWENNDFGMKPSFDKEAHFAKRDASRIVYDREFWFDITDVFERSYTNEQKLTQRKRAE